MKAVSSLKNHDYLLQNTKKKQRDKLWHSILIGITKQIKNKTFDRFRILYKIVLKQLNIDFAIKKAINIIKTTFSFYSTNKIINQSFNLPLRQIVINVQLILKQK